MGKLGLFLTRRQILFLRRAALAAGIPEDPEMQDLAAELKNAQDFVARDIVGGWGGNYVYEPTAEERKPVARRTTRRTNAYPYDLNIL
jgi:hypothetical protein